MKRFTLLLAACFSGVSFRLGAEERRPGSDLTAPVGETKAPNAFTGSIHQVLITIGK
ncbi:MAG: hypothetical protein N2C14_09645 [Planctomycetales bacterium]